MHIEGTTTLAAPPEDIWALLTDPTALRQIIPGCESLEPDGDAWRVGVRQRFGQTSGYFTGTMRLAETAADRLVTFDVDASGSLGTVGGQARISLEPAAGGTVLRYGGDVEFNGGLTIFSPRLLETTTRAFVRRSSENLAWQAAVRTGHLPTESEVACVLPPFDAPESPAIPTWRRFAPLVALMLFLAAFLWFRDRHDRAPSDNPTLQVPPA
jgi:carbon monoxide dehydrogenase subunit G